MNKISVRCPKCNQAHSVAESMIGKHGRCSRCGFKFMIQPGRAGDNGYAQAASPPPPPVPSPVVYADPAVPVASAPPFVAPGSQVVVGGIGFAITGLVLGIGSFGVSLIPCGIGWVLALLPAILGVVFASIGVAKAKRRKGAKVMGVVGLVLSVIALAWAPASFFLVVHRASAGGSELMNEWRRRISFPSGGPPNAQKRVAEPPTEQQANQAAAAGAMAKTSGKPRRTRQIPAAETEAPKLPPLPQVVACAACQDLGKIPDAEGIYRSAARGEIEKVKQFLASDPKLVSTAGPKGLAPLHYAAMYGQKEVAEILIARGAGVNQPDNEPLVTGRTPLHYAALGGHKDLVELLLAKGADVHPMANSEDPPPLAMAACSGNTEVVQLLLKHGANADAFPAMGGWGSVLYIAVSSGQKDMVQMLLKNGADCNHADNEVGTPLQVAVQSGGMEMVELLLQKGAEVNAPGAGGNTLLHTAVYCNRKDLAEMLLAKGADPNIGNDKDLTPLYEAIRLGHHEIAELLRAKGGKCIPSKRRKDYPLLFAAVRTGQRQLVECLLSDGANINEKGHWGETALGLASGAGYSDIVELLLSKGADVKAIEFGRDTPLHHATTAEVVELLVAHGADVNARNHFERTPLHSAAEREDAAISEEIVGALIAKGADVNAKDNLGTTPLDVALGKNHQTVAELLRQHGAVSRAQR